MSFEHSFYLHQNCFHPDCVRASATFITIATSHMSRNVILIDSKSKDIVLNITIIIVIISHMKSA